MTLFLKCLFGFWAALGFFALIGMSLTKLDSYSPGLTIGVVLLFSSAIIAFCLADLIKEGG